MCLSSSSTVNSQKGGENPNLSGRINEGRGGIHDKTAHFLAVFKFIAQGVRAELLCVSKGCDNILFPITQALDLQVPVALSRRCDSKM